MKEYKSPYGEKLRNNINDVIFLIRQYYKSGHARPVNNRCIEKGPARASL